MRASTLFAERIFWSDSRLAKWPRAEIAVVLPVDPATFGAVTDDSVDFSNRIQMTFSRQLQLFMSPMIRKRAGSKFRIISLSD